MFFFHENTCQPSPLQSKLHSIITRLGRLQFLIEGQESRRARSRLNPSFCTRRTASSQLASAATLPKAACAGTEPHCEPTRNVDQSYEMCSSPTLRHQARGPDDVCLETVIDNNPGSSEENFTPERQRLHGEGGEGHDCRSRVTEALNEEGDTTNNDCVQHCVQFWSGIQRDDQRRNSSAQNLNTTVTSILPSNSSLAPRCREYPPEGKYESPTGKCTDDGRGLVKTLSGRQARKLQRIVGQCQFIRENSNCAGCSDY